MRGRGAGAELLWIDLREAAVGALAAAQRADARALAASALGVAQSGALPARVDAALGGVPAGGSGGEAYDALAGAVWAAFGPHCAGHTCPGCMRFACNLIVRRAGARARVSLVQNQVVWG